MSHSTRDHAHTSTHRGYSTEDTLDKPGPTHRYPAPVHNPSPALPPHVPMPALPRRIRKVGAPIGVLILLGLIAGLIVIGLTALNPVGTAIGFVLSSLAMAVVILAYLWLDRWEPEPLRLLVLAFLWGASVAVILSIVLSL